jgi:hypothetical protein
MSPILSNHILTFYISVTQQAIMDKEMSKKVSLMNKEQYVQLKDEIKVLHIQ